MIKKIMLIITCMLVLTSCQTKGSTTKKYIDAIENTSQAKTMENKVHITVDIKDYSGNTEASTISDIIATIDGRSNSEDNKMSSSIFLKIDDVSMDANYYQDGDIGYLKTIFSPKYIMFNEKKDNQINNNISKEEEQLFEQLGKIWKESVQQEIMESEGSTVVNTPDGDVKVKILTLSLDDVRGKKILKKFIDSISNNPEAIDMLTQSIKILQSDSEMTNEEIREDAKDYIMNLPDSIELFEDKFVIETFNITAKVDKDNYIIEEVLELKLDYPTSKFSINISQEVKRWNINKPVEINLPKINEEDIMQTGDEEEWHLNFDSFKKIVE